MKISTTLNTYNQYKQTKYKRRKVLINDLSNKIGIIYIVAWDDKKDIPLHFAVPEGIYSKSITINLESDFGKYKEYNYDSFEEMCKVG